MKTGDLTSILLPLKHFMSKHHFVVFITVGGLLLALAVYALYDVLVNAGQMVTDTPTSSTTQFDQKTIDRIKNLHDSNDRSDSLTFPSPRANPFVE